MPQNLFAEMPVVDEAYFAAFSPATLALICEANLLEQKLEVMAGVESGLLWAAIGALERCEAQCPVLAGITSKLVEESYGALFRTIPASCLADVERRHGMNLFAVLPPRCKPNERHLDFRKPVTPGILLAEIIAKFDFRHGANLPLREQGMDMQQVCQGLSPNYSAAPARQRPPCGLIVVAKNT